MTPVFADTSYYVALLSPRDQHHHDALRIGGELRRPIVTTEFVLVELANALASTESRSLCIDLWLRLQSDPFVLIVLASTELVSRGRDLYVRRSDKTWSLTDCISFVVMEERGLAEALTADHDFEQAGFTALLR